VIPGGDGLSDFNGVHSARHNAEVQLCAFDVLRYRVKTCVSSRS
jgi:hypothetical protein